MSPITDIVPVTQGKFTSADGRVFEGDLVYDQIMAHSLNSSRVLNPLSGKALQPSENARLSLSARAPCHTLITAPLPLCVPPDMTLNIEDLLAMIPARERDTEYEQVRLRCRISS